MYHLTIVLKVTLCTSCNKRNFKHVICARNVARWSGALFRAHWIPGQPRFLALVHSTKRLWPNVLSPNKRRGSLAVVRCQETKTNVWSASRQLAPTWLQTIVVLQRSCGGPHLRQSELPFKEGPKPYVVTHWDQTSGVALPSIQMKSTKHLRTLSPAWKKQKRNWFMKTKHWRKNLKVRFNHSWTEEHCTAVPIAGSANVL